MKRIFLLPAVLFVSLNMHAQSKTTKPVAKPKAGTSTAASVKPLKTNNDSLSYAFGISLGQYLKAQGVKSINYAMMNKAITQTISNQSTYLDAEQANMLMGQLAEAKSKKVAGAEKEKGERFLEENKKKAGITVTPSGLQYEVLVKGTGPKPTAADTISAHYMGRLIDGKEFDNSYKRGEPLTIPVSGVIPGWTEALQLMPVGSKWRLFIPSNLAYGDYGAGQDIPGGATLVFEVELKDILSKKTQ